MKQNKKIREELRRRIANFQNPEHFCKLGQKCELNTLYEDIIYLFDQALQTERERVIGEIEDYFKGLIFIPDPQATKRKLIEALKSKPNK